MQRARKRAADAADLAAVKVNQPLFP